MNENKNIIILIHMDEVEGIQCCVGGDDEIYAIVKLLNATGKRRQRVGVARKEGNDGWN